MVRGYAAPRNETARAATAAGREPATGAELQDMTRAQTPSDENSMR